jgi:hypothetical protein
MDGPPYKKKRVLWNKTRYASSPFAPPPFMPNPNAAPHQEFSFLADQPWANNSAPNPYIEIDKDGYKEHSFGKRIWALREKDPQAFEARKKKIMEASMVKVDVMNPLIRKELNSFGGAFLFLFSAVLS